MSNTVRIDPRAFGRGVDEVLWLKPVRRAMNSLVSTLGSPKQNSESSNSDPAPRAFRAIGSNDKPAK